MRAKRSRYKVSVAQSFVCLSKSAQFSSCAACSTSTSEGLQKSQPAKKNMLNKFGCRDSFTSANAYRCTSSRSDQNDRYGAVDKRQLANRAERSDETETRRTEETPQSA